MVKVGEIISLHNKDEFLKCRDNIIFNDLLINLMIKNRKMKGGNY